MARAVVSREGEATAVNMFALSVATFARRWASGKRRVFLQSINRLP